MTRILAPFFTTSAAEKMTSISQGRPVGIAPALVHLDWAVGPTGPFSRPGQGSQVRISHPKFSEKNNNTNRTPDSETPNFKMIQIYTNMIQSINIHALCWDHLATTILSDMCFDFWGLDWPRGRGHGQDGRIWCLFSGAILSSFEKFGEFFQPQGSSGALTRRRKPGGRPLTNLGVFVL